ncbi:unnamed protein product, partial [Pylaiella littoralis]
KRSRTSLFHAPTCFSRTFSELDNLLHTDHTKNYDRACLSRRAAVMCTNDGFDVDPNECYIEQNLIR